MSVKGIQGPVVYAEHVLWDGSAAYNMDVRDYTFATFQAVGTGSVTWEASMDGTNWAGVQATKLSDGSDESTSTAAGFYRLQCSGFDFLRAGTPSGFTEIRGRSTT